MTDVQRLFSHRFEQDDQLIFATQLCNSILTMQERLEEKTNILYAVEQAISNELNHVLHQQHYDTLPNLSVNVSSQPSNPNETNDLISLKNSIYRSRELSRIQSKEMHDLDLSLREIDVPLASKYELLKSLEYETPSRSITPNQPYAMPSQMLRTHLDDGPSNSYETLDYHLSNASQTLHQLTLMKEADEDSGINSLTSEDSNHHSMFLTHQKLNTHSTQLETLV